MEYDWDFSVLWKYHSVIEGAVLTTLRIALQTAFFGIILGFVFALLRLGRIPIISHLTVIAIEGLRSVPPLVLLVWLYYCLPILIGLELGAIATVTVALSLYGAAFFAEIFRAGLQSIDRVYVEAGLSVGMSKLQILRRISAPLAFRQVLPPLVSQCVLVVKNTSLAGYVAVADILYQGQQIGLRTFRPLEVLTIVALIYLAIIIPLTQAANLFERHLRRNL